MNKESIKQLALNSGFKLKQQPNGEMDLNPYVYEFTTAVIAAVVEEHRTVYADCENLKESNRTLLADRAEKCNRVNEVIKERNQLAAQNERLREHGEFLSNAYKFSDHNTLKDVLDESPAASLAEHDAQVIEGMLLGFAKNGLPDTNWSKSIQLYVDQLRQQAQEVE